MTFIKLPSYITPDGIAQYPRLLIPDTKFMADGVYSVKMEFTGDDAKSLAEFLDGKMEESFKEAKKNNPDKKIIAADAPYSWNDSGTLSVNFKMKASGVTKDGKGWSRKPAIFNADLTPFEGTDIGGGSKLVISYTPAPFFTKLIGAGLSLRLEAVQVIELVIKQPEAFTGGFIKRPVVATRVQSEVIDGLMNGDPSIHAINEMLENHKKEQDE